MKISPLNFILDSKFKVEKKFYFISGNEKTLMEKIKSIIIKKFKESEKVQIQNIDTITGFVDEVSLFENKNIYLVSDYKGINGDSLNNIRNSKSNFIFFQENSQKIKKLKNLFNLDKDSYLIDCYELDKDSKESVDQEQ